MRSAALVFTSASVALWFAGLIGPGFPIGSRSESVSVSGSGLRAEPRTAGEWHTVSRGWYDIEFRHGPDGEFYYHFDLASLDGYRSRLIIFPADSVHSAELARNVEPEQKNVLLLIPDYSAKSYERLLRVAGQLRGDKEFHVAVLIPRGHRPVIRSQLHGAQGIADTTRSRRSAAATLHDFRAGLSALRETAPTFNVRLGRICIVAGDYYSNLLLTEKLPDVGCMVLLSPNRHFYDEDLAPLAAKAIDMPVLMAAAARFRYELSGLRAAMQSAALLLRSGAGNGYAMLYRKPDLISEIRAFVREPQKYVSSREAIDEPQTLDQTEAKTEPEEQAVPPAQKAREDSSAPAFDPPEPLKETDSGPAEGGV